MGLVDRVRTALRPENTLEAVPEPTIAVSKKSPPEKAEPVPSPQIPAGPTPIPTPTPASSSKVTKQAAYASESALISKSYYIEEKGQERFYYDDYKRNALAIRTDEKVVSSKRDDLNTIRAMLDITQARGWPAVMIRGTQDFKREAWIEATARGIEGKGFNPSDLDRQEADRRRAEQGKSNELRGQQLQPKEGRPQTHAQEGPRSAMPAPTEKSAKKADQNQSIPVIAAGATETNFAREAKNGNQVPAHSGQSTKVDLTKAAPKDKNTQPLVPAATQASPVNRAHQESAAPPVTTIPVTTPRTPQKVSKSTTKTAPAGDVTTKKVTPHSEQAPGKEKEVAAKKTTGTTKKTGLLSDAAVEPRLQRDAQDPTVQGLSKDGRLVYEAMALKIEKQMNHHNQLAKNEMKLFVASELMKKEVAQGPVVLSENHRRAATSPAPQAAPRREAPATPARKNEPDVPDWVMRR